MTVKGLRGGKKYTMGMPVRVTLVKADKEKRELDFVMGEIRSPLNLARRIRNGSRPKSSTKKKAKKGKGKKK